MIYRRTNLLGARSPKTIPSSPSQTGPFAVSTTRRFFFFISEFLFIFFFHEVHREILTAFFFEDTFFYCSVLAGVLKELLNPISPTGLVTYDAWRCLSCKQQNSTRPHKKKKETDRVFSVPC